MQYTLDQKKKEFHDVDLIITRNNPVCCIVHAMGMLAGMNSDGAVCLNHPTEFVDNNFLDYNHRKHLLKIKQTHPKYATLRDAISQKKCKENNIKYYSNEEIIEMYYDVVQYAKNVIIIPKYREALTFFENKINKFVVGISLNTYGTKTLDYDIYSEIENKGHRLHLLGGSPKKQIKFLERFGSDVVSIDTNYVCRLAENGIIWTKSGKCFKISDLNLPNKRDIRDPKFITLTLNLAYYKSLFEDYD